MEQLGDLVWMAPEITGVVILGLTTGLSSVNSLGCALSGEGQSARGYAGRALSCLAKALLPSDLGKNSQPEAMLGQDCAV